MLDLMRKHAKSWLIKVALGGIIIVFIFWYGWSGPGEERRDYVAQINDTIITTDFYRNIYYSELEKVKLRFRGSMPEGLLEKLDLKKRVYEVLLNQVLLMQEGQKLGMFTTDQDLVNDLRSTPLFQRNGSFDDYLYRDYLKQIRLSPPIYEQLRKQELLETQVVALLTDGVKTDPNEIKRLWHFQNDKLNLAMLTVKAERPTTPADPAALAAFFKENQARYEIPGSVDLEYVVFSWRDLLKNLSVSDEEARTYYQTHLKEFTTPEKVRVRHILVKIPPGSDKEARDAALKKIEGIAARIKAGESFDAIAKAESEDTSTAEKGGDLGFLARGAMDLELERHAFDLEPGQTSEPIKTEQGYHLLRVEEKQSEQVTPYEQVKDQIVSKLSEEKARRKVADEADAFYEKAYRTEDLRAAAKEFGFELKSAQGVTRASGIPDAGKDKEPMDEAFKLKTDELSRLIRSGENYIVMKLVKKTPERLPELDEVRAAAENDFQEKVGRQIAEKKAREIIEDLRKEGADPQQIASQFGLSWEQLDPVSRTTSLVPQLGNDPQVQEMLTTVSSAAPVFPSPLPITPGFAVVRLATVTAADDRLFEQQADEFQKWIVEVRQAEFLTGWLRVFQEGSKIVVNEKMIQGS